MNEGSVNYNEEDLFNHHGVCAIIKNKEGRVLMQKHVKYGFWTIPVGKVKSDQDIEGGLKEEILEECNVRVVKMKKLISRDYNYMRNGKNIKVIKNLFEILKYSGEIKNNEPEKHEEQKFMGVEEIKELPYLSDATLLYLELLGIKREAKI